MSLVSQELTKRFTSAGAGSALVRTVDAGGSSAVATAPRRTHERHHHWSKETLSLYIYEFIIPVSVPAAGSCRPENTAQHLLLGEDRDCDTIPDYFTTACRRIVQDSASRERLRSAKHLVSNPLPHPICPCTLASSLPFTCFIITPPLCDTPVVVPRYMRIAPSPLAPQRL